ncbi:putative zinc transporter P8A3.03 [Wickerhamiella sorbophila]|uniref:Putative zinc transporter P8A3.03 n=1 Tax=Wickerhamiella sorbophila TaxID=45607 RepID=A0A2T0FK39_9ASCO|nr:putative zinc transporter P8A3.03 [Wickerhamiella sorbophila]PRT55364.1 putative zinc transporter P8A3.03 [Wickerhamiella sorbophila]
MLYWLVVALVEAHGSHGHLRAGGEHDHSGHLKELGDRSDLATGITEFPLLRELFRFSPVPNSLLAIGLVTLVSTTSLWIMPPLKGLTLSFLVAFAAGCLLGNVMFHLLPAVFAGPPWMRIAPIIAFILFAYMGKYIAQSQGTSGHSHSHDVYAHRHTTVLSEARAESTAVASEDGVQRRKKQEQEQGQELDVVDTDTEIVVHSEDHRSGAFALVNVAADFLHNMVDGAALALAFDVSKEKGILSFVLMCSHEVPHQFGDFAILIQTGMSKASALTAHLATSSGLAFGALLYGSVKRFRGYGLGLPIPLDVELEDVTEPLLAGVFLYIATMGVFPELLEIESNGRPAITTLAQFGGLAAGLYLMLSV